MFDLRSICHPRDAPSFSCRFFLPSFPSSLHIFFLLFDVQLFLWQVFLTMHSCSDLVHDYTLSVVVTNDLLGHHFKRDCESEIIVSLFLRLRQEKKTDSSRNPWIHLTALMNWQRHHELICMTTRLWILWVRKVTGGPTERSREYVHFACTKRSDKLKYEKENHLIF
jgi:hypothetical protein